MYTTALMPVAMATVPCGGKEECQEGNCLLTQATRHRTDDVREKLVKVAKELIHPDKGRELQILIHLRIGAMRATDLEKATSASHPMIVKRSLDWLEERALVERVYRKEQGKSTRTIEITLMGERVLRLVEDLGEFLNSRLDQWYTEMATDASDEESVVNMLKSLEVRTGRSLADLLARTLRNRNCARAEPQ